MYQKSFSFSSHHHFLSHHALQQQKIHLLECPTCSSSFRCHLSEAALPPPIQRKEKKEKKEACRAINVKALKPFVNLVD